METNNQVMLRSNIVSDTLTIHQHLLHTSVALDKNIKKEEKKQEARLENEIPLFYTRPIFKCRKHDLL